MVALVLVAAATAAAAVLYEDADQVAEAGAPSTTTTSTEPPTTTTTAPPLRSATVAFGGDILIHSGVWAAADTGEGYDFSPMLAPIAPRLTEADLAICHLEVTLARPEEPLSSYPRFRAPGVLATDLAEAGFDGCSVASNHALDFGEQGVVATLDGLDARRPGPRRHRPRTGGPGAGDLRRRGDPRRPACRTRTGSTASCDPPARSGSSTRSTRR